MVNCAENKKTVPFLSSRFSERVGTLVDIIGALSLLDLPEKNSQHGFRSLEGLKVELKATDNLILFQKEIKEAQKQMNSNIQVVQRYTTIQKKEYLLDEFMANTPYYTEIIFTNISSTELDLEILAQIPEGSIPLKANTYQELHLQSVEIYSSGRVRYPFYFPKPGKYKHAPTNVAINGVVVAMSTEKLLNVVTQRTKFHEEISRM